LKAHPSLENEAHATIEDTVIKCKGFYGADMLAQVRSTYHHEKIDATSSTGTKKGDYQDEHQIRAKYPDNPARAEAILKNADSMWCKIGECKLYRDVAYDTEDVSSTSSKRMHNDIVDNINMKGVKGPKKPKTSKPAKALRDIGEDEPQQLPQPVPLTEKQEKTLEKAQADLKAYTDKLNKELTPVQDELEKGDSAAPWARTFPNCFTQDAVLAIAECACTVSSVDNMVSNKMADGFKELQASIKNTKENLAEQTRRLKLQVPEAKKAAKRNETVAE